MKDVIYRDEEEYNRKLQTILLDGASNLHIVSDFDRTLTRHNYNGKKIPSVFGFIRDSGFLGVEETKKAHELFATYHPIEMNHNLDFEYRLKKMDEWWNGTKQVLIETKFNISIIKDLATKYPKPFRAHTEESIQLTTKKQIPFLIFSAGIGNIIEEYLKQEDLLQNNIHILANTFLFNEQGEAIDYKDEIIHSLNKSEKSILHTPYHKEIQTRENVILLGDSIGDAQMTEGMDHKTILRIGFLNEQVEQNLGLYKQHFDVIVTHDGSMEFLKNILEEIN